MSNESSQDKISIEQLKSSIKWDASGLVPAVVQDAATKEVLMVAYMNREALDLSLEKGEACFWSRSRQELWHKGATSGNTQRMVSLSYDCDGDTLLVQVIPQGPACHTGENSCFYRTVELQGVQGSPAVKNASERFAVLAELEEIIAERDRERPEGAYTTYLFEKGVDKILKKIGEEASETIIAAKNKDNAELRLEVSDLIYHLLVLLQERKLPIDEIMSELSLRHERPRRD